MQTIKSFFSRVQPQAAVAPAQNPVSQPELLSAESLKLVGGGLPRVGGLGGNSATPEGASNSTLPSAS